MCLALFCIHYWGQSTSSLSIYWLSILYKKIRNKIMNYLSVTQAFLYRGRQVRILGKFLDPAFLLYSPKYSQNSLGVSMSCRPRQSDTWPSSQPILPGGQVCASGQHLPRLLLQVPLSSLCFGTSLSFLRPGRMRPFLCH